MRRRRAERRETVVDAKYSNKLLGKFINMLMECGKKAASEKIVYAALEIVKVKVPEKDPIEVFSQAIENVRPLLEIKSRRIGGATYQVPIEVKLDRGQFMAMRWIRDYARAQKGRAMKFRLADEIVGAFNKDSASIKKREDTHKMAEANRAFAHYKW
jgi:small subunit ribosomal protein S7